MSVFSSQMVQMRRDALISQSLNYEIPVSVSSLEDTLSLVAEACSLSFKSSEYEERLYEIYYILTSRFPRFVTEVSHPVFFRSHCRCLKYNPKVWKEIK